MSNIGAPQQHKQPSRKGKKAWRKNVDVGEVQSGLEALREEVRSGGPLSEKKAEEIFALDTIGSQEISTKYNLRKPLKVDEILAQRSAVPAIYSRKRSSSTLPSGIYEPASKKRKGDWVSKREVQRLRNDLNKTSYLSDKAVEGKEGSEFDLWSAEPPAQTILDELEYLPKPQAKTVPRSMRRQPIPMTASGKSVLAVQKPGKGTSYNPSFEEWDERLMQEGEREVKAEQLRMQVAKDEAEKQARITAAAVDEVGGRTDDESAWEGFETEDEDLASLRKKRPTRKTPAERNKATRKKNAERLAKHEKKMGKQGKVVQQLETAEKGTDLVSQDQNGGVIEIPPGGEADDGTLLRRRKMGNVAIPEKSLELVLPDELQDSLRLLKPEGNLLQDRFHNLLVNGKIESRKPVLHSKKKRVKYTEKWSYKDFEIQV